MQDLTEFVSSRVNGFVAPDSPGRILRLLRQSGRINYVVISRSKSLYRIIPSHFVGDQQELNLDGAQA